MDVSKINATSPDEVKILPIVEDTPIKKSISPDGVASARSLKRASGAGQRRLRAENLLGQNLATLNVISPHTPKIDPLDLEKVVGMPLHRDANGYCFYVDGKNTKGEAVGWAYFKPNEKIAWYWDPNNGFQDISSQNKLINAYEKNTQKTPFQFYKLYLNDNGIVVGSFLIDQIPGPGTGNKCPWFWWSVENGIHLSEEPTQYQLVAGINNQNKVLINILTQDNELNSAFVLDIENPAYVRLVKFPKTEIIGLVDQTWKKMLDHLCYRAKIIGVPVIKKVIYATKIDDCGNVSGTATISVCFKYNHENRTRLFHKHFDLSFNEIESDFWEGTINNIINVDGHNIPWDFILNSQKKIYADHRIPFS